jgi:hypothetical protein
MSGCGGGSPTAPTGGGAGTLDQTLDTAHFTLRYGSAPSPLMSAYGEALEASWPRITADLAQPGLPRIGDTLAALGVPFDQFERGWRDFVTARCL